MELQITWFILWGLLWAIYFMLDGFVFGTGFMSPLLARSDAEKRILIHTVGPVWDGNEVWLITAGGATFAAFPTTYALMFSNLYTALLLLLFALVVRGVCFEFRGKVDTKTWQTAWDKAIVISSLLPSFLFGVAFGNIFKGLPMRNDFAAAVFEYDGSLLTLLNPYGLLTGLLFVMLFAMHGTLYANIKTSGNLSERAAVMASKLWLPLVTVSVLFLAASYPATRLYDNFIQLPLLLPIPLAAVSALLAIRLFIGKAQYHKAFAASCIAILFVCFTGIAGLFPCLIPSSIAPSSSLTIFNSSSSTYTLEIMTIVAVVFLPVVIAYKIWVYRIFRGRVSDQDVVDNPEAY